MIYMSYGSNACSWKPHTWLTISTSIKSWTHSQNSVAVVEAPNLKIKGSKIRAGPWRFQVRFPFRPVAIPPQFTKTSGSLRLNIFDKLYYRLLNNLIKKYKFSACQVKDAHVIICSRWLCFVSRPGLGGF